MILKVEDALKPFSRTDPDCEAYRDLRVITCLTAGQSGSPQLVPKGSLTGLRYENNLPIYTSTAPPVGRAGLLRGS